MFIGYLIPTRMVHVDPTKDEEEMKKPWIKHNRHYEHMKKIGD